MPSKGEKIPIVFYPRYTTLNGTTIFTTTPIDFLGYNELYLTVWRGDLSGTTPAIEFAIEDSVDMDQWSELTAPSTPWDPGADTSETGSFSPNRRYIRCRIQMTGTDPSCTVFAVGYATRTVT